MRTTSTPHTLRGAGEPAENPHEYFDALVQILTERVPETGTAGQCVESERAERRHAHTGQCQRLHADKISLVQYTRMITLDGMRGRTSGSRST